jgi:hypothetical protein
MKNSKPQSPSTREAPNSNFQKNGRCGLVLDDWFFHGGWGLVIGASFAHSSFVIRHWQSVRH